MSSRDRPTEHEPTVDEILRAAGLMGLPDDSPLEAVEEALRRLGELSRGVDPVRLEALRAGATRLVRPLGFRTAAVDAALTLQTAGPDTASGSLIQFQDPEPWPESVDGTTLLDELEAVLTTFIALPECAAPAIALWVVHAHALDTAAVSPILALTSPEKRCGKTTTLHVLHGLVPRPLPASNITTAATFRVVEAVRPTLLIDEADTFLDDHDGLRGILNSGHVRGTATVVRAVGEHHEVKCFSTWAPKVIAKIGDLPDTLQDRSVVVRLRRKSRNERVRQVRLGRRSELGSHARKARRWVDDNDGPLREADPDVPLELNDRMADNWRPLLAIADVAGGRWPTRAREAALHLAGASADDDGSVKTLLLGDLRKLFEDRRAPRLSSQDIVDALLEMEERPWPEWGRSRKPITARALARLLKPFDIKPTQFKIKREKVRGYLRGELEPAFERYLEPLGSNQMVPPVPARDGAKEGGLDVGYPTGRGTGYDSAQSPRSSGPVPEVPLDAGERDGNGIPYDVFERWCIQTEGPVAGDGGLA